MSDDDLLSTIVPPLPPRYRFRDVIWGDSAPQDYDRHRYYPPRSEPRRPGARALSQHRPSGVVGLSDARDTIPPPPKVHVEFFTNEKSIKERLQLYFIKNQRSSLRIRTFNLIIKLLTCILYMVRVSMDESYSCEYGVRNCGNGTTHRKIDPVDFHDNPKINWDAIIWVDRHFVVWICQVTVAIISLAETILVQYLSYKGNVLQQIISTEFLVELVTTIPVIFTLFEPLRNLYIPVFLNCWLAKQSMQKIFSDLHRVMQKNQSALAQQLLILCATLLCLVFISACGIQHLQRGGNHHFGVFESFWLVVVTLSTVGYGDVYPDIWPSQLFMLVMIICALVILPTQFEQLACTWLERQKLGGTYSSHRAQTEKHVIVVTTTLQSDTIMDFMNEFYAHPMLQSLRNNNFMDIDFYLFLSTQHFITQDYFVVLLSPCELDPTMKMLLQVPLWAQRVIYVQGSALKDGDLARCRAQDAEACFILAARNYADKTAADQHTILRSWAIKDFSPKCPLYVQIFRPENKFHVKFADHVVCEDEFKYALLANNCLCPGTSTLVTLLLHTSRGQEGQMSNDEWQRLYGRCSGNEIYHIKCGESKFFGEYIGKSFTYASFHAHRKYGVSLVGVQKDVIGSTIQLNPGPRHILRKSDCCFYMNLTKEENSAFILAHPNQENTNSQPKLPTGTEPPSRVASMIASIGTVALELQHTRMISSDSDIERQGSKRTHLNLPKGLNIQSLQKRPSIAPVPAVLEASDISINILPDHQSDSDDDDDDASSIESDDSSHPEYVRGFPPVTPYVGTSPTLCHLSREKRHLCCLELCQKCDHCNYTSAKEYCWSSRIIIVAADYASNGLYNFIVPLRSHARESDSLNPIVLLFEQKPDIGFLETICYFPMIYWMLGSIDCLSDLLRAGINLADNVVVVNKESSNSAEEDTLSDCNTIVSVQTIFRLFPNANIITELTQSSNMRFMQFRAHDLVALAISKLEKKERQRGSHIYYMFRLPFAAGNVFSASMLDTLLYQAFVKDYLITFVRLLLGIDQAVGSGHLSCMKITKEDLWIRTYGRLYQKLCSTTCEIPIGIYRTQNQHCPELSSASLSLGAEPDDIMNMNGSNLTPERQEIIQMVKCRMQSQGLPLDEYDESSDKRTSVSYAIINPNYDLKLELGDVVYLIRPSSLSPQPSPLMDERRLLQEKEQTQDSLRGFTSSNQSEHSDIANGRTPSSGNPSHSMDDINKGSRIPVIYYDSEEEINKLSNPAQLDIVPSIQVDRGTPDYTEDIKYLDNASPDEDIQPFHQSPA